MTDAGLVWGDGSVLVRMSKADQGPPRLFLDADRDRFATLISVVGDRPVASNALEHVEAADRLWQRGDKALANLRLIFADLPRLATLTEAYRLTLAAHLLDEGMAPSALAKALGLELATEALKYAPDQARIPAGHGVRSGQFTFGRDPATGAAARIILASEEDSASENPKTIEEENTSGPLPRKIGSPPHHSPFLTPLSLPPPPPVVPRVGGAGGEGDPAPQLHDHPPLLQPGPPPPNSQHLPPGIGPGKYANGWVPAVPGKIPDAPRQRAIDQAGDADGCHVCGTKDPGTKSGHYVGDHQDPNALNPPGRPQYFLPMCKRCSSSQGGRVTKFKYHPDRGHQ